MDEKFKFAENYFEKVVFEIFFNIADIIEFPNEVKRILAEGGKVPACFL
jgi:hypothetical protein